MPIERANTGKWERGKKRKVLQDKGDKVKTEKELQK